MTKVLLIHTLTLSRIPLSFLFCTVLLLSHDPLLPCAALFLLVAVSDYLDGKLARKYKVQSRMGAVLDVAADFFFIGAACSSLNILGLLPGWMLAVILIKFIEFWISSAYYKRNNNTAMFLFDPLGRLAAVLFYALPVAVLLFQFCFPEGVFQAVLEIICTVITGMAVMSSFLRITSTVKRG